MTDDFMMDAEEPTEQPAMEESPVIENYDIDAFFEDDYVHGMPDEVVPEETTDETETEIETPEEATPTEPEEPIELSPADRDFYARPEFKDAEEELNWHRERFSTLDKIFDTKSGYLQEFIENTRTEALTKLDEELDGLKVMYDAMQKDPRGFLLQYMPEALQSYGINPILSTEQILERVATDLTKEFGENYESKLNPADMFKPHSFASKVWARQQQLLTEWDMTNRRNEQLLKQWNDFTVKGGLPQPKDQVEEEAQFQRYAETEFQNYFAPKLKYTKEQFDEFISKAKEHPAITLADIEKIVNFNKYVDNAYKRGLTERGRGTLNQVKQTAVAPKATSPSVIPDSTRVHKEFLESFMNGGMPNY
jgi:hypothetical protein